MGGRNYFSRICSLWLVKKFTSPKALILNYAYNKFCLETILFISQILKLFLKWKYLVHMLEFSPDLTKLGHILVQWLM